MTSAAAATLSQIQRDAFIWQRKNFGEPNGLLMIAGALEEFGEAQESLADTEAFIDGVSDCCIFVMQLSSVCGFDIGELWDRRDMFELPSRPWPILLGKISHHYVKGRVSHYRGTTAEHDERCRGAISALLRHWDQHLASLGHDFVAVVDKTWRAVSERDWTRDRPAPGNRAESAWVTSSGILFRHDDHWELTLNREADGRGWWNGKNVIVMVEQASEEQMAIGADVRRTLVEMKDAT